MLLYSKATELFAIYLITTPKYQAQLLPKININHFHLPAAIAAYQRYLAVLQLRSESLTYSALQEDPAIIPIYRELLVAYKPPAEVTPDEVEQVYSLLETYRVGRAVSTLMEETSDTLAHAFDANKLLDSLADGIVAARTVSEDQKLYHIGEGNNTRALVEAILDQKTRAPIIPTGFAMYDQVMGGLPDTGLVVLAATTSSGKSTMANQLALNINKHGWDVCKVSLEMTQEQEMQRFLSNLTGIPHKRIHNKKLEEAEITKIRAAYSEFVAKGKQAGKRLSIIAPTEDLSLTQLLMLVHPFNYKVIIIDYITLLKEKERVEQWKHLSEVAREAKRYTLKTGCLIIMLAQLDSENRIRYSRAIQEHCVTGDTWVNVDGKLQQIGKIATMPQFISAIEGESAVLKQYTFTEKYTYTFTTSCGYQVSVSGATPILTSSRYQYEPAHTVKVGDTLILARDAAFAAEDDTSTNFTTLGQQAQHSKKFMHIADLIGSRHDTHTFLSAFLRMRVRKHRDVLWLRVAKPWQQYIQLLLLKFGVVSRRVCSGLVVSKSILKFLEVFPLLPIFQRTYSRSGYNCIRRQDCSVLFDDVAPFLDVVTSITTSVDTVYDFTVADHNFLANGIVVHNSDVVWTWHLTDADRENNKFTVNQTKGRNQGLISFEINSNFECMRLEDTGNVLVFDNNEEKSDLSDIIG